MKTTIESMIKQFKELALEYAEFLGRKPLKVGIYFDFGKDYKDQIRVYFSRDGEYSIGFEKIEVNEWTNKITIPMNYTVKDLKRVYNAAKKYLNDQKDEMEEKKRKTIEREKEELKKRLSELEKYQ